MDSQDEDKLDGMDADEDQKLRQKLIRLQKKKKNAQMAKDTQRLKMLSNYVDLLLENNG